MYGLCMNAISRATRCATSIPSVICTRYNSVFSRLPQRMLAENPLMNKNNVDYMPVRTVKNILKDSAEPLRIFRFDKKTGKRTSSEIVPKQFFRLHWGIWIRTRCGRDKTVHKKNTNTMRKVRKHVFVNGQQTRLLDRLTGPYYKRRHYYVDDPYEPYHTRNEFYLTRKIPLPGIDGEVINYV